MRKQDNDYIDLKNMKDRDRVFSKFNKEQKEMFKSIQDNIFTFVEAKSGTGKTLVSISAMIDLLANDEINKIVYFQKVSDRYLEHGFLAGSLEEKTNMLEQKFELIYEHVIDFSEKFSILFSDRFGEKTEKEKKKLINIFNKK